MSDQAATEAARLMRMTEIVGEAFQEAMRALDGGATSDAQILAATLRPAKHAAAALAALGPLSPSDLMALVQSMLVIVASACAVSFTAGHMASAAIAHTTARGEG